MGCWNETCAITNLPIHAGDPIVYFLLEYNLANHTCWNDDVEVFKKNGGYRTQTAPNQHHSGHCYATDIWSPISPPIYGKYNDYGNIEEEEPSLIASQALKYINDHLTDKEQEKLTTVEAAGDLIHSSVLYVNSAHGKQCPIGMIMVHRWVYDLLAANVEGDWYKAIPLSKVIEQGEEFYNYLLARVADEGEDEVILLVRPVRFSDTPGRTDFSKRNIFFDVFGPLGSGDKYHNNIKWLLDTFAQFGITARRPLNDPEVQCLITELSKFFQFNSNLYNLRKAYIPQCGKSQQGVSDIQKTILQASLDYIAAKEAAYDTEFGMDDEALEAAYTAQGLAVVKDEDGKIIGLQG